MEIKQIFPPAGNREAWAEALKKSHNRKLKKEIMNNAKVLLESPVPVLTASLFMNYVRNGNRNRFETPFFDRRRNLGILAVAEAFEYKGKYIDKIIDYIWEICAEHTWCVPAHCEMKDTTDPFPEFPVEIVDLFNSETGSIEPPKVKNLRYFFKLSPVLSFKISSAKEQAQQRPSEYLYK